MPFKTWWHRIGVDVWYLSLSGLFYGQLFSKLLLTTQNLWRSGIPVSETTDLDTKQVRNVQNLVLKSCGDSPLESIEGPAIRQPILLIDSSIDPIINDKRLVRIVDRSERLVESLSPSSWWEMLSEIRTERQCPLLFTMQTVYIETEIIWSWNGMWNWFALQMPPNFGYRDSL